MVRAESRSRTEGGSYGQCDIVYDADHVTRTFTATGRTVEHLSGGDTVRPA
jgi:hypothetical protein